jgi:thiazole synthase
MLNFYGKTFSSRLLIGSALYPSPAIMQDAIRASGANIVTVSLRREAAGGKTGDAFWSLIRELDVTVLPNTAGCRGVREAVTTAKLARELFGTSWIKLEVIADNDTLQPDAVGLVEAAGILIKDGFEVFPYCTEDLSVAMRLVDAGCKVVMPWAAPIGSAKGIVNRDALKLMRERCPTHAGGRRRLGAPLMRPTRWNSATTPCCSTPRSPRRAIPWAWRKRFASRSRPVVSPTSPG